MLYQNDSLHVNMHSAESEVVLYRRRFPFPLPEGMRCVLFEENEEISVRIYHAPSPGKPYKWENLHFLSLCKESDEKASGRLERQTYLKETGTFARLFSERLIGAFSEGAKVKSEYYTLHICGEDGCVVLFRAFTASSLIAYKLFDCVCQSALAPINAIDFFRESRALILRELWFYGA